jgi:hypothetical protein
MKTINIESSKSEKSFSDNDLKFESQKSLNFLNNNNNSNSNVNPLNNIGIKKIESKSSIEIDFSTRVLLKSTLS